MSIIIHAARITAALHARDGDEVRERAVDLTRAESWESRSFASLRMTIALGRAPVVGRKGETLRERVRRNSASSARRGPCWSARCKEQEPRRSISVRGVADA